MREASASARSTPCVSRSDRPVRSAAAGRPVSGPGAMPSSANTCRCRSVRRRRDQDSTVGRLAVRSSESRACRPRVRSSATMSRSGRRGSAAARAAISPSARGNPPHSSISSTIARSSAAARSGPRASTSSVCASVSVSTSRWTGRAPWRAISPRSWLRLVITTTQWWPPGSSGTTWSVLAALSSTMSIRLSATRLRYSSARPSRSVGLTVTVDAQRGEEPAQHVDRVRRLFGGAEAAQVHEQLPVGKPVQVAVRPGQRQPRLADPAGPADRRDQHRPATWRPVRGQARVEPVQLVPPAHERRGHGEQLPGNHDRRGHRARGGTSRPGSAARICRCRSCNALPGSVPSSSTRRSRSCR